MSYIFFSFYKLTFYKLTSSSLINIKLFLGPIIIIYYQVYRSSTLIWCIIKKNKEAAALKAAAVAKKPGTATVRKTDGGSLSINKQGPDYTIANGKINMFTNNMEATA